MGRYGGSKMSVEDVMKVNQMARNFLDQGVSSSRDEAVEKAQEMLNKDITGENTKKEIKKEAPAQGENMDDIQNTLKRMKEQTERKFEAYRNALMALEKEIVSLKSAVNRLNNQKPAAPVQESAPAAPTQEAATPAQPEAPASEEKESHPRTGNHKAEEVSIEKMFYYGNK